MATDYDTINLPLVEHFASCQGEGANAGRAAFFIRFSGCNLDCIFGDGSICDTPWRQAKEKLSINAVLTWIADSIDAMQMPLGDAYPRPLVIVTGGEPTMARQFDALVKALHEHKLEVAVESNGTLWREGLWLVDHLVVSPKVDIQQGNPSSATTAIHPRVLALPPAEYRYVIADRTSPMPPFYDADHHFVSPAVQADGRGMEVKEGVFPGFNPGAVERCIEIVQQDPRWRISLQTHKVMVVR